MIMAGNQSIKIYLRPVADRYAGPWERIIAISGPDGTGCLVSIRADTGDGQPLRIEVYQADPGVYVYGPMGEGK